MRIDYSDYLDDGYLDELAEENLKRKYNKKKKKIKDKVEKVVEVKENIDDGGRNDY